MDESEFTNRSSERFGESAQSFTVRWICAATLIMQAPTVVAGTIYDFALIADGAVIARLQGVGNTTYPSVIRIPGWISPADRADPTANYYMYYGTHNGLHIHMKWAQTVDGPWTEPGMPLGLPALTPEQIQFIETWLLQGAKGPAVPLVPGTPR